MSRRAEEAIETLTKSWEDLQEKMPTLLEALRTGVGLKEDDFSDVKLALGTGTSQIYTLQEIHRRFDRKKNPPPPPEPVVSNTSGPTPAPKRMWKSQDENAQEFVNEWLAELVEEHRLCESVLDKDEGTESFEFEVTETRNESWVGSVDVVVPDAIKECLNKIFASDDEEDFNEQLKEMIKERYCDGSVEIDTEPGDGEITDVEYCLT